MRDRGISRSRAAGSRRDRPTRGRRRRGSVARTVLVALAACGCVPPSPTTPPVPADAELVAQIGAAGEGSLPALPAGFRRGMNLEPIGGFGGEFASRFLPSSLAALARLGVDHVALVPSFFQERLGDTAFTWSGSRERVREETRTAIRVAHRGGLAVLLKPHLWLRDRSGDRWRGDIDPAESAWPAWSEAYRGVVLEYARLGDEEEVEALSIGSELARISVARPEFWRGLVAEVRTVYSGTITYAANWDGEFESIEWWDAVDLVGVDAFWPLLRPGEEVLTPELAVRRLEEARDRMAAVSRSTGRPVLITEIGYRSAADGAAAPWRWHDEGAEAADPEVQAIAYRAIARVFARAAAESPPWLEGLYFWLWSPDLARGGPDDGDFTPRGKPAEGIVRAWFGETVRESP